MSIQQAQITFNQAGTPVAEQFDDVYFSMLDGQKESQYVFIDGNQLDARWPTWQNRHFVIAETGFGTGLNFLSVWHAFNQYRHQNPDAMCQQLHFISFEKYPMSVSDIEQALSHFSELQSLSEKLISRYPKPLPGCHRLHFDGGNIILDLWMGDVHDTLPDLVASQPDKVDAWFLDGFAPSKNPEMWTTDLYQKMVEMSATEATFATFTAAGDVRRGLQSAGFTVAKRKGFGRKREMLIGQLPADVKQTPIAPYFLRQSALSQSETVTIIGGGIAAASATYALAQRGYKINLLCADSTLAQGASGNPQGGFYPQLQNQLNPISAMYAHAYLYANRVYRELNRTQPFEHEFCGVLQLAFNLNTEQRYRSLVEQAVWPTHLFTPCTAEQTSQIAGVNLPYSSLYFAEGGWINVADLVTSFMAASKNITEVTVNVNSCVTSLVRNNNSWQIHCDNGLQHNADVVVLASGADSEILQQLMPLPLMPVRGQVSYVPTTSESVKLKTVLCHKGYMTPASSEHHTIGSTYSKHDKDVSHRDIDNQQNQMTTLKALTKCDWVKQLDFSQRSRAGVRCTSPDHVPLVGAVADITKQTEEFSGLSVGKPAYNISVPADVPNLFMLTALGSRGLCTAPLMAEVLASQIANEPLPMSGTILNAVNPNRFLIRALRRNQCYPA